MRKWVEVAVPFGGKVNAVVDDVTQLGRDIGD